jgi:hypothetical protein
MKKHIYTSWMIALIVGILFVSSTSVKAKAPSSSPILSVNEIQADPSAYKGVITITGVVAKIDPSHPDFFALIDTKEAKLCNSTGCANFYLPVQYGGKSPIEWDEVNVTGTFVQDGSQFNATKVEVLKHLTFEQELR